MRVRIEPGKLRGRILAQPSKSYLHRALICAALGDGTSEIRNVCESQDVMATLDGLTAMGLAETRLRREDGAVVAEIRGKGRMGENRTGETWTGENRTGENRTGENRTGENRTGENRTGENRMKVNRTEENRMEENRTEENRTGEIQVRVNCGESGSTLRLLIPLALAKGGRALFQGSGRLLDRPMGPYEEIFKTMGIGFFRVPGGIQAEGRLVPARYELAGNVSSQFVSGLLLALPLLDGDSLIALSTPLESRSYVEMTLETMATFGVRAYWENERLLSVPGRQSYQLVKADMEGDWSHAAFFLAAGALGGDVTCLGLNLDSLQGDKAVLPLLERMGASVRVGQHEIRVSGGRLIGIDADVSQIPDLAPVLAALGCGCQGVTRIYNASRLRMKESDRLSAMSRELRALGADLEEGPDWMEIRGKPGDAGLTGGFCHSHNDHRVAMSLAVASAICQESVTVTEAQSVAKSSPTFWDDLRKLGAVCDCEV
jgi:3-phosphoshikimate 1-carboxyvinyltransferase